MSRFELSCRRAAVFAIPLVISNCSCAIFDENFRPAGTTKFEESKVESVLQQKGYKRSPLHQAKPLNWEDSLRYHRGDIDVTFLPYRQLLTFHSSFCFPIIEGSPGKWGRRCADSSTELQFAFLKAGITLKPISGDEFLNP